MHKNEPKVAIVMINYNGKADTIACVESLEKTSYSNKEIFIVDNASPNGEYQQLKEKFKAHTVIESARNEGFSGGNNIAIKEALSRKCDYILLLNNDTVVSPSFLEPLVQRAQSDPQIGAVGGKIYYHTAKRKLWFTKGTLKKNTLEFDRNLSDEDTPTLVDWLTGCLILIPRRVIEEVGLLDEAFFMYCEDLDLSLRIREAGYQILYEPKSIIWHKVSASADKVSNLFLYYFTRNQKYLIQKHTKGPRRFWANFIFNLNIFRMAFGFWRRGQKSPLKAISTGLSDFRKGIQGYSSPKRFTL